MSILRQFLFTMICRFIVIISLIINLSSMKHVLFAFIILGSTLLYSQRLECSRPGTLIDQDYEISGSVVLEKFDDGSLHIKLIDYETMSGPDVQLFLANDNVSVSGAVKVVNLTTESAFNGTYTFEVPAGVDIDDFDHLVFRCVRFSQPWASANFGETICEYSCKESVTATTQWVDELTVCSGDNISDDVVLLNSIQENAGDHYTFVITDTNNKIQSLVFEDEFNFEDSGEHPHRIFGVSYSGELSYSIGEDYTTITATECATTSGSDYFLTILKGNCELTGIEEASFDNIVYPNPTSGIIYFNKNVEKFTITDLMGQVILTGEDNNYADLSTQTSGVYLLKYDDVSIRINLE